jgi:hypothetical protein
MESNTGCQKSFLVFSTHRIVKETRRDRSRSSVKVGGLTQAARSSAVSVERSAIPCLACALALT